MSRKWCKCKDRHVSNEILSPKFSSTIVAVVPIHRRQSGTLTPLRVSVFISMVDDESLQQCNLLKNKTDARNQSEIDQPAYTFNVFPAKQFLVFVIISLRTKPSPLCRLKAPFQLKIKSID